VSVGHILRGSDLVTTVPERLADRLVEPFGPVKVPHPAKLPDIEINVFWHAKHHRSPANCGVSCSSCSATKVHAPD